MYSIPKFLVMSSMGLCLRSLTSNHVSFTYVCSNTTRVIVLFHVRNLSNWLGDGRQIYHVQYYSDGSSSANNSQSGIIWPNLIVRLFATLRGTYTTGHLYQSGCQIFMHSILTFVIPNFISGDISSPCLTSIRIIRALPYCQSISTRPNSYSDFLFNLDMLKICPLGWWRGYSE